MTAPTADAPSTKDVVAAVVDGSKLITTLSTGVLAFSLGLVTATSTIYSESDKSLLLASWVSLAVAIVAGVILLFYVPALYGDSENFSVDRIEVRVATMFNLICFCLGSLGVGLVMVESLHAAGSRQEGRTADPVSAVRFAAGRVGSGYRITKVSAVELLKGLDPAHLENAVWHIQFEVLPSKTVRSAKTVPSETIDFYVNPLRVDDSYSPMAAPLVR